MAKKLEQQRQELEERRIAFEKEKAAFELVSKDMEEIRRVNTLDLNMKELVFYFNKIDFKIINNSFSMNSLKQLILKSEIIARKFF